MEIVSPGTVVVVHDEALRKLLIRALELIAGDPEITDFSKAFELLRRHVVWQ